MKLSIKVDINIFLKILFTLNFDNYYRSKKEKGEGVIEIKKGDKLILPSPSYPSLVRYNIIIKFPE